MRATLNLDDDDVEAARAFATIDRRPLGEVVSEFARRGLAPQQLIRDERDELPFSG
jgi:hypothetical protein